MTRVVPVKPVMVPAMNDAGVALLNARMVWPTAKAVLVLFTSTVNVLDPVPIASDVELVRLV
jgi:hypothetical protein